jgi:4'-phosphopantetheinyl transferase
MIDILHISNDEQLSPKTFAFLEGLLPEQFRGSFQRYRRWKDRQAGLFGKLLLRQLLIRNGVDLEALTTYSVDAHGRPFIDFAGDFNISHTDGRVIAAITDASRIGVDIEKIRDLNPLEFTRVFTSEEAELIGSEQKGNLNFFNVWTKKEAAMKADGRGFYLDAAKINTLNKRVRIEEMDWLIEPLEVSAEHICHYSIGRPGKRPSLAELSKEDFA